jgi:hypothetical protein
MFLYRVGAGRCRQPYSNESHRGTDQDFLNHFGFVDEVVRASLSVAAWLRRAYGPMVDAHRNQVDALMGWVI